MWWIFAILVAIVGIIVGISIIRKDNYPLAGRITTWTSVAALVAFLFFSTFVSVPTKDIGIKTVFGKPSGALSNGAHLKWPWEDVSLMDGAVQTDTHDKAEGNFDCVNVRIAHQIVACADVYIKWRIIEDHAETLFEDYREFNNIQDSQVNKNLQSTLNQVFETYDPLAVDAETGQSSSPELSDLSALALTDIQTGVGTKIEVSDLQVTVLHYDKATQSKINALQGQVAETRIAEQSVQTAKEQAAANAELSASVSNSPYVLVSKCYDLVNEMIAKDLALPAAFTCWPGGSSAVVLPAVGNTTAPQ